MTSDLKSTKLFKAGNATAVRLDKESLKVLGWDENTIVVRHINTADESLALKPKSDGLTDEFYQILDQGLKDNHDALDFLKDK